MSRVLRIVVQGRVQGVGFRYHTAAVAKRHGIAGWVRNLPSGDVEILARLDDSGEAAFLAALRRGPPGSLVRGVEVKLAPQPEACPSSGFTITG